MPYDPPPPGRLSLSTSSPTASSPHSAAGATAAAASPSFRRTRSYSGSANRPLVSPTHDDGALFSRADIGNPHSMLRRLVDRGDKLARALLRGFAQLSRLQQILLLAAGAISFVAGLFLLIYYKRLFAWLAPLSEEWRGKTSVAIILWLLLLTTAFPPMIGYSTGVTAAGFIFGFPRGWPLVATANVIGSLLAFLLFRHLFSSTAKRLANADYRFAALSNVLARDGFKLLTMIRLCPLPYSLSNAALASIPAVSPGAFAGATAIASPKLLLHVFAGSRLAIIARDETGLAHMDASTKAINWISIIVGGAIGVATSWIIYQKTVRRIREFEQDDDRYKADGSTTELSDLRHPDAFAEEENAFGVDDDSIDWLDDREDARRYRDEPRDERRS